MKLKSSETPSLGKKNRSCAYPLLSLPPALAAAKSLCDSYGEGPYSRTSAAKGLGYSSFSGAASGKIGALVHFGLLDRAGGMYSVSSAAKAAFSYPENGGREAIAVLAQKPVLYRRLIGRFLNKPLPEKLEAVLAADYGITGKAAPVAAQNFIQTLEFAELVREGRLFVPDLGGIVSKQSGDMLEEKTNGRSGAAIKIKLASGIEILFPEAMAYRLSMGEFAAEIKSFDAKAGGM